MSEKQNEWVTLRCPKCRKEQQARSDSIDPENAVVVQFPCPDCNPDGFDDAIQYFDKEGTSITPGWAKEA